MNQPQNALLCAPVRSTLFYENGDLRYIKYGDREVIRRIYAAVRDRNWGTTPPKFSNMQMDIGADAFRIAYDVENVQGEVDFAWHGEITGDAHGTLRFSMDGVARSTFWRNRIGFCILHPAFLAGARCVVEHVDGTREEAVLPTSISAAQPVQPFSEMSGMAHEVLPGVWAEVRYSGDIFEIEDQRNWTDASYKTFCTPLRIPYPVEVQAGTRVSQSVTLSIRDERRGTELVGASAEVQPLSFSIVSPGVELPLPPLGLGSASHGQPLGEKELERLRLLNLGHLRVDLHLADPDYGQALSRAWDEARSLGIPLEVALLAPPEAEGKFRDLRLLLDEIQPESRSLAGIPSQRALPGRHAQRAGVRDGSPAPGRLPFRHPLLRRHQYRLYFLAAQLASPRPGGRPDPGDYG